MKFFRIATFLDLADFTQTRGHKYKLYGNLTLMLLHKYFFVIVIVIV